MQFTPKANEVSSSAAAFAVYRHLDARPAGHSVCALAAFGPAVSIALLVLAVATEDVGP